MRKYLFLVLVIFLIGCTAPEAIEPKEMPDVKEPVEEPVEQPTPVETAPEDAEPEEPKVDNKLRQGFLDLENYQGSPEDILFEYLQELDEEQLAKTQQRKYMKWEKKYEGQAQIYYPKWQELDKEFLEKEANMIGSVWSEANAGVSQYFEATLYDYRGVIVAKVVVKKGEVKVTVE